MREKNFLSRARELDREINRTVDRLGDLYAAVTKCTSQLTGMPGGHNDRAFEDRMGKYMLLRDEINADIDRLVDLKTEICALIDTLPEEKHRNVLERFYLQGMSCREIGAELDYDPHYVLKLKRDALKLLKIQKVDTK